MVVEGQTRGEQQAACTALPHTTTTTNNTCCTCMQVRITALVGNTYHARVHYARDRSANKASTDAAAAAAMPAEVDVDARPSGDCLLAWFCLLLACFCLLMYDGIARCLRAAFRLAVAS